MKDLSAFPEHLSKLFDQLVTHTQRLANDMHSGLADSPGAGFNDKHSRETRELAKASKELGQEIRAWLDTLDKKVTDMGQKQRLTHLVDFIQALPPAVRYDTYDRLMYLERNRADGIRLEVPARTIVKKEKK